MLRVTPIYGSKWNSHGPAPKGSCTLVEYANVKVLVNIGLPPSSSSSSSLSPPVSSSTQGQGIPALGAAASSASEWLLPQLPPHDCLVLSDSTLASLGGLPLYCQRYPDTPIYATFPTVKMGQMTLWDYHAHISLDGGRPPFTVEQMDSAIARLQTIKYSQSIVLQGSGSGSSTSSSSSSSITAHRAGHVVGGAFWVLQRLQDETVIVITSTYSIAKEKHLESSTLLKYGATPDVLVTRPGGPALPLLAQVLRQQQNNKNNGGGGSGGGWKLPVLASQAQQQLTERILSVLRRDGNVLLPVDASGRVLELLLLLDQHWEKQRLGGTYNLVWLGPMVGNTLDFARSQLEWMNLQLSQQSQKQGQHSSSPYALRQIQLCTNTTELEAIIRSANPPNPTCVLANGATLDHGPARDLLLKWADNDNNAIFFTDTSQCWERTGADSDEIAVAATVPTAPGIIGGGGSASGMAPTTTAVSAAAAAAAAAAAVSAPKGPTAAATLPTPVPTTAAVAAATGAVSETDDAAVAAAAAAAEGANEEEDGDETTTRGRLLTKGAASKYTAAYQLLHYWCQAKLEGREMDDCLDVDVLVPRRAPLTGVELAQFLEVEEQARLSKRKQEEQAAMLREVELAKGRLRLGEQQSQQQQGQGQQNPDGQTFSNTMAKNNPNLKFLRPKKKSRFDSSLFLKFSKPLHLTFFVKEEAVGIGQKDAKLGMGETSTYGGGGGGDTDAVIEDDYGIAVEADHFVDIVTGVDPSKFAGGSGRIGDEVLRRGFGFGASTAAGGGNNPNDKRKNKRRKALLLGDAATAGDEGDDDDDEDGEGLDERGLEAMDLSEGRGIIRGRNGRPPTKVTTEPRRVQVFCEIDYIPIEGRVDSRAARQSVRALQPRQVVVLGGTKPITTRSDEDGDVTMTSTTDSENQRTNKKTSSVELTTDEVRLLADAAESFSNTGKKVQCPSDAETAELNVGHAAYSVRLIATPYRSKEEREQEEELPEAVEMYEAKLGACTVSFLDYVATGQRVALDGSVVLAPRPRKASNQLSIYLSDGEVLLTDLRTELIAQGMKAEYSTHSGYARLVVNGKVVVKKDKESGRVNVEGPLCEDFFTVRSIVCGQFVTL